MKQLKLKFWILVNILSIGIISYQIIREFKSIVAHNTDSVFGLVILSIGLILLIVVFITLKDLHRKKYRENKERKKRGKLYYLLLVVIFNSIFLNTNAQESNKSNIYKFDFTKVTSSTDKDNITEDNITIHYTSSRIIIDLDKKIFKVISELSNPVIFFIDYLEITDELESIFLISNSQEKYIVLLYPNGNMILEDTNTSNIYLLE